MRVDLRRAALAEGRVRRPMYIEKWSDQYHEAASQLISAAYAGHVDSRINDQYRSPAGARRFLYNIMQYPGCGAFYRPASFAAFEAATGRLCGISLASLVASATGHITQICVSPAVRGTGIGHALLRQSLETLRANGVRFGQPDGDRGQHGCRGPVPARGIRGRAAIRGLRVGRLAEAGAARVMKR